MPRWRIASIRGREVDEAEALDARGRLKSGFGMRVPLQLCDTMQKDIAEFAERHHTRFDAANASDAANGFFDSRGIWFPPDQRLVNAQRAAEYLAGRDEAMRQQWLNGRRAVNDARKEMIEAASAALRQSDSVPSADVSHHVAGATGSASAGSTITLRAGDDRSRPISATVQLTTLAYEPSQPRS